MWSERVVRFECPNCPINYIWILFNEYVIFSSPLVVFLGLKRVKESNEAEFIAMRNALRILGLILKGWLSKVTSWMLYLGLPNQNAHGSLYFIRNNIRYLSNLVEVEFQHISRDANELVHFFTSTALILQWKVFPANKISSFDPKPPIDSSFKSFLKY